MRLFGFILIFLLLGCRAELPPAEEGSVPEVSIPGPLQEAKLVFQRQGNIYLASPLHNTSAKALVNGQRPRWNTEGTWIAFLQDNSICRIFPDTGVVEVLSEARNPRTLAVPKTGNEIWYSDDGNVMAVNVITKEVRRVVQGFAPLEMDVAGEEVLGTVKVLGGYRVRARNVHTGKETDFGFGCSASFSPDGTNVTRNEGDHMRLALHDTTSTNIKSHLQAPEGRKTDNQFWSTHPDWIVSMDEESGHIYAHRVSDNSVYRITEEGGGDRPDLWVP
jgi:hypothetical protein